VILPDGFESMETMDEVRDALIAEGIDDESAEVYADLAMRLREGDYPFHVE